MLVFDGAMGTGLLARQHLLTDEDYLGNPSGGPTRSWAPPARRCWRTCTPRTAAGADVLETDTFQGSLRRLTEWGLASAPTRSTSTPCAAPGGRRIASRRRSALASWPAPSAPAGPPSSDDPALQATFAELEESGYLQTKAFVDGGADLVIIETQIDLLETKATIFGMLRAFAETGRASPSSAR